MLPGALHVVAAAILDGGRCLAVQRSETMTAPLLWELPGGKVEAGETPREALVREIREELALEIIVEEFLGRGTDTVQGPHSPRELVLDVYRAQTISGHLALQEHRAARWLGADQVSSVSWAPADRSVLPALAGLLKQRSQAVGSS